MVRSRPIKDITLTLTLRKEKIHRMIMSIIWSPPWSVNFMCSISSSADFSLPNRKPRKLEHLYKCHHLSLKSGSRWVNQKCPNQLPQHQPVMISYKWILHSPLAQLSHQAKLSQLLRDLVLAQLQMVLGWLHRQVLGLPLQKYQVLVIF